LARPDQEWNAANVLLNSRGGSGDAVLGDQPEGCLYPKQTDYVGSGSRKSASSYVCQTPRSGAGHHHHDDDDDHDRHGRGRGDRDD
jgi:hypothetical protein